LGEVPQRSPKGVQMRNVILGTDWWTDCDDIAAVRIACRMYQKGVWNLRGISIDACMPYSAASLDAFVHAEGLQIPIAIDKDATDFGGRPSYQKALAATGLARIKNEDCETPVSMYRRILAECPNGSVELMEIGFPQVLAALLTSAADEYSELDGRELIRQKVSRLWIMAGQWANGREHNFCNTRRASEAAAKLCAEWNTDIVFLGYEVGVSVITHPAVVFDKNGEIAPDYAAIRIPSDADKDLLYLAFCRHGSANGRCSWDPMLVLLAAETDGSNDAIRHSGYETVRGTATVNPADGSNTFTPDENGSHRYVIKNQPDSWYSAKIEAEIR